MSPNALLRHIHAAALGYPEAYEEEPWGHPAIKVRKKAFVFCSALDSEAGSISVKLPASSAEARTQPGVVPTGYGLGRHGWCSISLGTSQAPLDVLLDWVDESYRSIAPKTLVRRLGETRPAPRAAPEPVAEASDVLPRVLLVGAGPKRLARAVETLREQGIVAAATDLTSAVALAGDLEPEALVVDLGRRTGGGPGVRGIAGPGVPRRHAVGGRAAVLPRPGARGTARCGGPAHGAAGGSGGRFPGRGRVVRSLRGRGDIFGRLVKNIDGCGTPGPA